nr:hypothetical protein [Tanacetum cinerariifolium]
MYLTSSRPDIVHATCLCDRYQPKLNEKHLKEVKRIFRYLRGTVNTDLWYMKDSGFKLTGFSDVDYARCKDTFKSTSGGAQFLELIFVTIKPVPVSQVENPPLPLETFHPFQFSYPPRKLTMEEMLYKFIDEGRREHKEMGAFIREFKTTNKLLLKERNNSLTELEFKVYGLSKAINNAKLTNYEVKCMTTRGGKTTNEIIRDTNDINKEPLILYHDKPVEPNEVLVKTKYQETKEQAIQPLTPLIPFPHRLKKEKEEALQRKFLENLKQLHINIPFTEALSQMPKYAKFQKGLLSNKTMLKEACTVTMNERFSAVLPNKLLSKEKDPGSFTIPCDIGHLHINNALADLGAIISLREPKPTRISLELADRPCLATTPAMIDVFNKKKTLRVGNEEVIFDVDQSIKRPPTEDDECYRINFLDTTIHSKTQELLKDDQLDSFLVNNLEESINLSDLESYGKADDIVESRTRIRRIK